MRDNSDFYLLVRQGHKKYGDKTIIQQEVNEAVFEGESVTELELFKVLSRSVLRRDLKELEKMLAKAKEVL